MMTWLFIAVKHTTNVMSSYVSLQFKYVIFRIFTCIICDHLPDDLITQLVEHCTGIAEVIGFGSLLRNATETLVTHANTNRISTPFSVFGNVIKHGLSCLTFHKTWIWKLPNSTITKICQNQILDLWFTRKTKNTITFVQFTRVYKIWNGWFFFQIGFLGFLSEIALAKFSQVLVLFHLLWKSRNEKCLHFFQFFLASLKLKNYSIPVG